MGIAHELITRGWYQGDYEGPDGSVCLAGASECSLFGECMSANRLLFGKERDQALMAAKAIAEAAGLPGVEHIAPWNDDPERTFDEVLRVAKEADELLGL